MKRKLYFADKVDKINEKLATQTRTVVITEQSFYNIGGLCLKITRRILIKNIGPISTHSCTHCTIWTQSNFGFFASFFELIFLILKWKTTRTNQWMSLILWKTWWNCSKCLKWCLRMWRWFLKLLEENGLWTKVL